jgi:hypothetical protein
MPSLPPWAWPEPNIHDAFVIQWFGQSQDTQEAKLTPSESVQSEHEWEIKGRMRVDPECFRISYQFREVVE